MSDTLPPAKSEGTEHPVGGLSACGHTFRIIKPDATWGEEAVIIQRVQVCRLHGFALHYDPLGFRISHIETGAAVSDSYTQTPAQALASAEHRLSTSASSRGITVEEEMGRVIGIVQRKIKDREASNAPAAPSNPSPEAKHE